MNQRLHIHNRRDEESYLDGHIYDKHFQGFDQLEEVYFLQKRK